MKHTKEEKRASKKLRGRTTLSEVAKLLAGEGFSEHCANLVKRYWFRRCVKTPDAWRRLTKLKKVFGAMVAEKLDDRDRIVLGKFLSVMFKAQFDTGLRLGLMTHVAQNAVSARNCIDEPWDDEDSDDGK